MKKVKILGAGSIGNHLAHACRTKGWSVLICDIDKKALERTKNDIYPSRYGVWDPKIRLSLLKEAPKEHFDIVIVGTPPDTHLDLALEILREEKPQILLIEKPLCTPSLKNAQTLFELSKKSDTTVLVGYNHVLAKSTIKVEGLLNENKIGQFITMNGGFNEHWGGIFKAHPWLAGPHETYLGFTERGGGASGEHSHAINIWQHFARVLGIGRINEVSAFMDFIEEGTASYDRICNLNVKTEKGFLGQISQDVIAQPTKKYIYIQGDNGFIEWRVNKYPGSDAIISQCKESGIHEITFPKTRPDDFKVEIEHINEIIKGEIPETPISLERGLDTMMVVAAANISHQNKRIMTIDYNSDYRLDSIKPL
ncbi:hypothetical protein LCGC14_0513430 [marine sediment metagenome]|uniref:Gfo/Idh/MocA-like oxidoreductase N-terminal domain-containing protein n=1 Tax=marine sediment metagenome TaxID=412755 RepID=A0A0F9V919_9ZZZZ